MTPLKRPTPTDPPTSPDPASLRSPFLLGLLAAAQAAAASLLCVLVPVVAFWMASARTTASWTEALRLGADGWLLSHHVGIAVPGGHVGLAPLGLTLLPALWCWVAGRRLGEALRNQPPPARRGSAVRALSGFVGCYSLLVTLVSLVAASPLARPLSGQALVGGAVLAAATAGPALLRVLLRDIEPSRSASAVLAEALRLPARVRRAVPAATLALAVWLTGGAVATVVGLVAGRDRIATLHGALDPGWLGGVGLVLSQLVLLPVAVLWGAAWVAGPGFAVGAQTSVTPAATTLGALPAFPLLGSLPEPGTHAAALPLVLLVPVLGGVVAGWRLRRRSPTAGGRVHDLLDTACVVGVAGLGALALAALSSGPAGPGRMAELGPSPVLVALAVAAEVGAGCVAAVLLLPRHEGTRVSSNDLVLAARTQLGDGLRRVRSMIRRSNSS